MKKIFALSVITASILMAQDSQNPADEKMAIILNIPSYDPSYDTTVTESFGSNSDVFVQKINGKDASDEDIEELNKKLERDIEAKNRISNIKQQIISEQVSSILDEKGIDHTNLGSKIVVDKKDLSGEDIADLTAHYYFVSDVVEELPAVFNHENVQTTLQRTGVDPSLLLDKTPFTVERQSEQNQSIGVMLWEAENRCPTANYGSQ